MAKAVRKNVKVVRKRRKKPAEADLPTIHDAHAAILLIRGERVILDVDLARLYGVTTKALNQAVARNAERFPSDFSFRLNLRDTRGGHKL